MQLNEKEGILLIPAVAELLDIADKNTGYPDKFEHHINNEHF